MRRLPHVEMYCTVLYYAHQSAEFRPILEQVEESRSIGFQNCRLLFDSSMIASWRDIRRKYFIFR